ncbi:MAG: hypothetical protein EZS28_026470 [Streblomastix strix]|uniref:Uncharacterized protein n=1 Tax=Streblomastix strix TaxID=222440 RepID=A0A5J4V637_9EUKA|nr:MAG: hypothetical protein EZS28_026470 [Streblomastix strix]
MESNQEVQISTNAIISFTDSYTQNKQRKEKELLEFESKSARAIISFTDSYAQNKQRKQNEQQESESTLSLAQVTSRLESLSNQIQYNNGCKLVIQIPKLLQSLIALVTFRIGTHLKQEIDLQRIEVRRQSRWCLSSIQVYGDEQIQSELVRQGYGRVMSITLSKAGGIDEEQDEEIYNGLRSISRFLRGLHAGRNNDYQPSFQPLPLLARRSIEQLEEEGANEEIEAQMNNRYNGLIKVWANDAKDMILNCFIYRRRR